MGHLFMTDRCFYQIDHALTGVDQIVLDHVFVQMISPFLRQHDGVILNLACQGVHQLTLTHQINQKIATAVQECGARLDCFYFQFGDDERQSTRQCLKQALDDIDDDDCVVLIDDGACQLSDDVLPKNGSIIVVSKDQTHVLTEHLSMPGQAS